MRVAIVGGVIAGSMLLGGMFGAAVSGLRGKHVAEADPSPQPA